VWLLAPEPSRYGAIVQMMHLREELREYVAQINAQAAATGMPMARPMFLQWPLDAGSSEAACEDQYMFGDRWLVAPVVTQGAASRSVHLPRLPANQTWVYYFNLSEVGQGGGRVDVPTPITEFPLFFIRPLPPPPPVVTAPATFFYSAARNDTVVCVSAQCYSDNGAGQPGDYAAVGVVGQGLVSGAGADGSVSIGGRAYATAPLTVWFSAQWSDNFVATGAVPPDASYAGNTFGNGRVLAEAAPGAAGVSYWYRRYSAGSQDFAAAAAGGAQEAWCVARGYTNITAQYAPSWWLPAGV
jgi:hypothetical protein